MCVFLCQGSGGGGGPASHKGAPAEPVTLRRRRAPLNLRQSGGGGQPQRRTDIACDLAAAPLNLRPLTLHFTAAEWAQQGGIMGGAGDISPTTSVGLIEGRGEGTERHIRHTVHIQNEGVRRHVFSRRASQAGLSSALYRNRGSPAEHILIESTRPVASVRTTHFVWGIL